MNYINATIKSTGENKVLLKGDDNTLFEKFYTNFDRTIYYNENELNILEPVIPNLHFELNNKQMKQYLEFQEEHSHAVTDFGLHRDFSLIFTPTGLGNIVEIKCNKCNKILDISDIDNW